MKINFLHLIPHVKGIGNLLLVITAKRISAYIALISFLALSCHVEPEVSVQPDNSEPISISRAKEWYQKSATRNARVKGNEDEKLNRLVYWDGAHTDTLSNGTQVVIAPLFYNYKKQIILPQDSPLLKKQSKNSVLQDLDDYSITKKIVISKDEKGGFRACVIAIIPNNESRKTQKRIQTKTFEGTILVYNQDESSFLFSMEYKKGKWVNLIRANGKSKKGARLSADCYQAIYQYNAPNQVGGSSDNSALHDFAQQLNVPTSFFDSGGNLYSLVDITDADCSTGNPSSIPYSDPVDPNEANWVFPRSGGGTPCSGCGPHGGPNDPPVPIDEGQPINLGPTDLWIWSMLHRSAGSIYFNEEENNLIHAHTDLTYSIGNYVQQYGQKPEILNFVNNYVVVGPDVRINNLKQKLNCFGSIDDGSNSTYKLTLYVDQPIANSRLPYRVDGNYRMVGHTFLGLEKHKANGETVRLVFGFYVENTASALTNSLVTGAWGDDGGTQYDVSVTNDVSAGDFFQVINSLKSVGDGTAPDYHIVSNNCTTFSYNLVGALLGLPPGSGSIGFLGTGRNPADMAEDIRGRASQYGSKFNSGNNISAPSTTNCN